jgi:phosphopantothenoylcysteine decarboxylase / phosphopantothenate---cysteine ligase
MKILLGVTGCIAAYKAVELLRLLEKQGFEVVVAMTQHAQEFVAPLTFAALSHQPVYTGMFGAREEHTSAAENIDHIRLTHSLSALLIAPATANILAKMAHGIADDFLSTLYLANTAPVIIAPAMNVNMWNHAATRENLQILKSRGHILVEPGEGYLAEGISGKGRLADLDLIVEAVCSAVFATTDFSGKTVLITAGPTCEDLDPVRFISNRSSGKMGYALAAAARQRGARCILISGPTALEAPAGVERIMVRSARQMREAVLSQFDGADIIIKAAAVADYQPIETSPQKIKKKAETFQLELRKTPDILAELGKLKGHRILVGFAAETDQPRENALQKMKSKNLDLIITNDVTQAGAGFDVDTNIITIFDREGTEQLIPLQPKLQVAHAILNRILRVKNPGERQ